MPQKNQFPGRGPLGSATDAFVVTPGASELPEVPRALWVGSGGNIAVKFNGGDPVVLKNIQSGTLLSISPSHVLAAGAGTTAIDIVGLV